MNRSLRLGAAQMELSDQDRAINMAAARRAVEEAVSLKLDLLLLPELWHEGYALDRHCPGSWAEGGLEQHPMAGLAREAGLFLAGTMAVQTAKGLTNRLQIYGPDGRIIGHQDKVHLFGPGGERQWFVPATDRQRPEVAGWQLGGVICYDLRFPEWSRRLCIEGARVLLVPAQWPKARGQQFRTLLTARALENQVWVLAANRVGGEAVPFAGHSGLVDPKGNWLADAGTEASGVVWGTLDPAVQAAARRHLPLWQDRRPDMYLPEHPGGAL
ncbi:MAG: nitrilase-related carbon-nitrogen hydrolase [Candidatus Sericytochromatia bacterium]|nr:nitrilase-related carbon-nitrogen hydrolase [Candidatus Sericytochromatia bacterium]